MSDAPVQQFTSARGALTSALITGHAFNRLRGRGSRLAWSDQVNPQVFTQHPRILPADPNEVGIADYATNNAIQVSPVSWDGEQGASAPVITKTV